MAFDYSILDGRTLGGDQGEGVMLEQVLVRTGAKKDEEEAFIELLGTAKTILRDPYNPSAGFDELPEPIPVAERVKVVLAGKDADNSILFSQLNREFQFDPPLVDSEDEWERFLDGTKNSVKAKLEGAKIYFKAKKNPTKAGEKPTDFYFSFVNVQKRKAATMEEGGAAIKALLAKKKAKAAAPSDDAIPF